MPGLPRAAPITIFALAAAAAACDEGQLRCAGPGAVDGHCPAEEAPLGPPEGIGEGEGEGEGEAAAEGEGEGEGQGGPGPPPGSGDCGAALGGRAAPDLSGGSGGPDGDYDDSIDVDGTSHPYRVITPVCDDPGRALGVAMILHGADADRDYLAFKWRATAASRGYLLVLPEARRTFGNQAIWVEHGAHNQRLIDALLTKIEADHEVDRSETLLVGFGAGATFAAEVVAQGSETFEYLFAVNSSLYSDLAEDRAKVFLVAGERESPALAARASSPRFRYEFVEALGRWYPGPAPPESPGDPGVTTVTHDIAIDWFHAP